MGTGRILFLEVKCNYYRLICLNKREVAMKRVIFAVVTTLIFLSLSGCGGGGSSAPPLIVAQIASHPAFDGDIKFDPPNIFTIT